MSSGAAADLHKCTHGGRVAFSDQPCPPGAISESIDLPEQESTRDRLDHEASRLSGDYRRLASGRRVREIDFEIETNQRKIDENNDKLIRELSELQVQAEALGYTKGNPPDRIKLSKRDYVIAQQRNSALAQQDVQNQIHAVATKYQTENILLDDRITRLYAEKAKIGSTSNEAQAVENGRNDVDDPYRKTVNERRLREIDDSIEARQRRIDENDDKKNREIDELQRKLDSFGDNPLNESGRQGIYISMQAVTLKYQLQNAALNRQIAHLRAERTRLQ
jgi:hypothetical protein